MKHWIAAGALAGLAVLLGVLGLAYANRVCQAKGSEVVSICQVGR